ncbi:hypothetical protein [Rhizohabitans arisaemae]|uniref:hypothetical protein n=1 Tax=Rhizohabitans arisaemae TaxID=2720610 RepID=UPI0024B259AA|nr:hypothetical protein [Rhizohabitans arisaemae]
MTVALRDLKGGRSYATLDRAVRPERLPSSTLADLLNIGRCTVETFELFLRACDVPRDQWQCWQAARDRASVASPGLNGLTRVTQTDPRRLGVHAAIDAPGAVGDLPVYVPRDTDTDPRGVRALISRAAERGGMVVLVGDSSVGKTRSAYEAIHALLPEWWLLHPADPTQIRQAAATPPPRLVVWLDELQNHFGGQSGLDAPTVRALLQAGAVLVATLWPNRHAAYTALPAVGQADTYRTEREALGLADVVHLGSSLSPAEQGRARAVAGGDPRIELALQSGDYGMTQVIAAAPQLVSRWRGADPYAAAVLNAAIDATRLGVESPLSADLLQAAAPGYCDARQRASAPANWFEAGMAYVTELLHGATAALAPVAAPGAMGKTAGYVVADYLRQHAGRQRRTVKVPATVWQALCDYPISPADRFRTGRAAMDRLLYCYAEPLLMQALDAGADSAALPLTDLLEDQGRVEEAIKVLRVPANRGDRFAADRLVDLLVGHGSVEAAIGFLRVRADCGDGFAALGLAWLLQGQGQIEEALNILRILADGGDRFSVDFLAELLWKHGLVDELRVRADAGDKSSAFQLADQGLEKDRMQAMRVLANDGHEPAAVRLAELLVEHDLVDELRVRADTGDRPAKLRLSKLLRKHGLADELRVRADRGDGPAAAQLAELLVEHGLVGELRVRSDAGNVFAAWQLAELLVEQGRTDEAIEVWRVHADVGEGLAVERLADLLREQGREDELRACTEIGYRHAAGELINLMEDQGRVEEVERLRRFGLSLEE